MGMTTGHTPRPGAESKNLVLLLPTEAPYPRLGLALQESGFSYHTAQSPQSALRAMAESQPQGVVIDASFLARQGSGIIESIRVACPSTAILVLVEAKREQLRLKTLLMGVDDCVALPCTEQEILVRLCRAIDKETNTHLLHEEIRTHRQDSQVTRMEMLNLRNELQQHLRLLKHGVDFHRNLNPDGGQAAVLKQFLETLAQETQVRRLAYLGLFHEDASWFRALVTQGVSDPLRSHLRIPRGSKVHSYVQAQSGPVAVEALQEIPGVQAEHSILSSAGFTTLIPQLKGSSVEGIVLLGESYDGGQPAADTIQLAEFLTASLTPTLALYRNKEHGVPSAAMVVSSLVGQLERRDPYLHGHSSRVARISEEIAQEIGLTQDDISWLVIAATIHDVGRFESDAALWTKDTPLDEADWDLIRAHPLESARLAASAGWPEPVLDAVRHHHERWDGNGYPFGLEAREIPLFSRIIAVADGYDALTNPRAWRGKLSPESALQEIQASSGTRYDPELVQVLLERRSPLKSA